MNIYPPLEDTTPKIIKYTYDQYEKSEYYGEVNSITNQKQGRGIQVWNDGTRYAGYWEKDKTNIKGKITYSDGTEYEGEIKNDKTEGYGRYINKLGAIYEGEWKEDLQN